jgi:hypothetical protein
VDVGYRVDVDFICITVCRPDAEEEIILI